MRVELSARRIELEMVRSGIVVTLARVRRMGGMMRIVFVGSLLAVSLALAMRAHTADA